MITDHFEKTLLEFKYRKPFEPFVVELRDDRAIEIDDPGPLVFAGNGAGYLDETRGIVDMRASDVRTIRTAHQEGKS